MVYGMRSSVVHFSRFPTLCSSIARRVWSYVDDFTVVDVLCRRGHRPQRVMLGVHVRVDVVRSCGKVTFEPKTDTVQKICALSTHHLQLQSMTPAEASKLRGMAGWCASNTFGRVGRLGLAQLKRRQYATDLKDFELDAPLMFGLQFLIFVLPLLAPRRCADFRSRRKAIDCLLWCQLARVVAGACRCSGRAEIRLDCVQTWQGTARLHNGASRAVLSRLLLPGRLRSSQQRPSCL